MADGFNSDKDYFASYSDPGVHRLMISDHPRTDGYRRAIESCVEGKRVLDVGTGTGILSLFAARAGAEWVIAVDNSAILETACELAAENNLAHKIQFVSANAETMELDGPVDVIMSEWMGFFGLAELMFRSVIHARDKWLRPGGVMIPGQFRLQMAPTDDVHVHQELGAGLWERPVYGLDFSLMIEREVSSPITAACDLSAASLMGPPATVLDLDLHVAKYEDFFFTAAVELPIERSGRLSGFGGWFEVDLVPGVTLSCSPMAPRTHWRQSYFPVRPFVVQRGDVVRLAMEAQRPEFGDDRLPLYFMNGELVRDDEVIHTFFYRHLGTFE
ncbi:MAG: class I SAM-dependent methyltransferase [Planctomycetota bacterium]